MKIYQSLKLFYQPNIKRLRWVFQISAIRFSRGYRFISIYLLLIIRRFERSYHTRLIIQRGLLMKLLILISGLHRSGWQFRYLIYINWWHFQAKLFCQQVCCVHWSSVKKIQPIFLLIYFQFPQALPLIQLIIIWVRRAIREFFGWLFNQL
jgi:hypothetical protein